MPYLAQKVGEVQCHHTSPQLFYQIAKGSVGGSYGYAAAKSHKKETSAHRFLRLLSRLGGVLRRTSGEGWTARPSLLHGAGLARAAPASAISSRHAPTTKYTSLMEQEPEATGEGQQTLFPSETDEDSVLRKRMENTHTQTHALQPWDFRWAGDHSAETMMHLLTLWNTKITKPQPCLRYREKGSA